MPQPVPQAMDIVITLCSHRLKCFHLLLNTPRLSSRPPAAPRFDDGSTHRDTFAAMRNQVLIVGAGPTGLVLALWLARSGVSLRIIEKNDGPGQASRAMAVQARTLEFYRQLGIAEQVIASGIRVHGGHLREGSRVIADFPFDDIGSDISPFPFVLSFPQDDHEHLLVKCLEAAGVRVEWSTQLINRKKKGSR